jgi:protein TonB
MAPQFAVSNYGPKPERPELLAVRAARHGDRPNRRHIAASLLFHLLVLFGIFLLPHAEPVDVPVPLVTLVLEGDGAAGSAGGRAGGGGGSGKEAGSAPAQTASAEPAPEARPPQAKAPEEKAPEEKPIEPTPQAVPEPPAPEALAPAPVVVPPPPPKPRPPAVKPGPHAVKPVQQVQKKPVEKPSPEPAPVIAAEPPRGARTGPGAAAPTAQPGTAASGTASAGPGGAAGVGTGASGSGRGAFGRGKGNGDDYLERVRSWILKYRKRPPDGLKQDKSTILLIALARDGTVLEAKVAESSGVPVLDQMALDWVHRASPVPPAPANIPGEPLKFRMSFDFRPSFLDRLF